MKPFAADVRLTVDLVDTLIDGQSASLANVTQPFEAAFADLFARNVVGTLVSIDLRPVNLAHERERKLHWTLSGNVTLGHVRRDNGLPAPGTPTPQPPPPKPQVSLFALMIGNYRFSDLSTLRDGQPTLDLLDGASLTGTGGRPRWDLEGTIGGRYGALNLGMYSKP